MRIIINKEKDILPVNGENGDARGDDLEPHEEDVRREIAHELDDGRLVVFIVEWEREEDPHRRHQHEQGQEEKERFIARRTQIASKRRRWGLRLPSILLRTRYQSARLLKVELS